MVIARILETLSAERRQRVSQTIRRLRRPARMGTLRRTTPLGEHWGADRGTPVDRYYIERFLEENRRDIRGRTLELLNADYTDRFGTGVKQGDVLDIAADNPKATIVADLAARESLPAAQFDCFILTQTLHLIYDVETAVANAHRTLCAGGVLLATAPTLSRLSYVDNEHKDYWRFTPDSCARLFGDVFGEANVTVRAYGNVLTAVAFLMAMAWQELSPQELEYDDPAFPVVVTVRAVKR